MKPCAAAVLACLLLLSPASPAAESAVLQGEGLRLRLVSDLGVVVPGSTVTVGLLIEHEPGFHTYWRSPGMVGMATALSWELPAGARAGEIRWPGPMRTKMAGVTAWGYEQDTCLLTEIEVPEDHQGEVFRIGVEAAWMCCARTCHPGFERLELSLAVGPQQVVDDRWSGVIARAAAQVPVACPGDWQFSLLTESLPQEGPFEAVFELPATLALPQDFSWQGVYFFADDNQVDSDAVQQLRSDPERPARVAMTFQTTAFAPENPGNLSGVLYHPGGWPGLGTRWMRVSAAWQR